MATISHASSKETPTLSRRVVLGASLATLGCATAVAVPALAEINPDAELLAMVREWREAWDRLNALCQEDGDDPDIPATMESLREFEERIARTRATTREGLLAKAQMPVVDSMALNGNGIEGEFEDALATREATGHFMGLSIILDILHMNGGVS